MLESVGSMGYGGNHLNTTLPRVLIELQQYTISGPLTGAAANTAIAVTDGIDTQDTLIKALQVVTSTGVWSALTVKPTVVNASGTLTLSGLVAGDVVGVDGKNYTAIGTKISPTDDIAPYQFQVGASDTATAANLAAAINASDNVNVTATSAAAVVTITAVVGGTGGNAITLAVTGSNSHATRSAATLASGATTAAAVSIVSLFASGTLTLSSAAAAATAVVNGKTYTLATLKVTNSTNLSPYTVPVGTTDTITAASLAAAINAADPTVLATSAAAVVTIQSRTEGTGGNAITLVGGTGITASGSGTLAGGSATNAIKVTSDTTGAQVFLHWFKKDRLLTQA